jgi:hypothetical protein
MLAPPYLSSSLGMPVVGLGALPFLSFLRARAISSSVISAFMQLGTSRESHRLLLASAYAATWASTSAPCAGSRPGWPAGVVSRLPLAGLASACGALAALRPAFSRRWISFHVRFSSLVLRSFCCWEWSMLIRPVMLACTRCCATVRDSCGSARLPGHVNSPPKTPSHLRRCKKTGETHRRLEGGSKRQALLPMRLSLRPVRAALRPGRGAGGGCRWRWCCEPGADAQAHRHRSRPPACRSLSGAGVRMGRCSASPPASPYQQTPAARATVAQCLPGCIIDVAAGPWRLPAPRPAL